MTGEDETETISCMISGDRSKTRGVGMSLKKAVATLVVLAILPGSCVVSGWLPKYRAEKICASVELGAPFSSVEELVRHNGPPVQDYDPAIDVSIIKPESIEVVYYIWRDSAHWTCYIDFANGKVSAKQVVAFQ